MRPAVRVGMTMASAPASVTIVEVGPRDGLQNESALVPTTAKIAFVEELAAAGLPVVETTSFVNPAAVPQLADAAEVMVGIHRRPGVRYPVLIPNERGLDRAEQAGVDAIALFTSATEAFCRANIRCSIDESFARFRPVVGRAKPAGMWIRGYVSVAFACPYSGPVDPEAAVAVAERLFAVGCDEVSIADTIGAATPADVDDLLDAVGGRLPLERTAVHFHDTAGRAIDNVAAAFARGVRIFDAAAGGLGGCPFAPGAPGNVATESVVAYFDQRGIATGVDRGSGPGRGRSPARVDGARGGRRVGIVTRRVPPYSRYAAVYDAVGQGAFGERIAESTLAHLHGSGRRYASAVDLACGTGAGTVVLAASGLATTAVDRSPAMLEFARERAEAAGLPVRFLEQDLRDLALPEPVDLATCFYDSLNYVTEPEDLGRVFRLVRASLRPGGCFAFDLNTRRRFAEAWNDTCMVAADRDGLFGLYRSWFEPETGLSPLILTFFVRAGDGETDLWERFEEEHIERAYRLSDVESMLAAAAFARVEMLEYSDRLGAVTGPGSESSHRVLFFAWAAAKATTLP